MRFYRTPALLPAVFPKLLWRMPDTEKTVYLTFDDGPVPGPTGFVLQTLKQAGIKATFFCIGDNIRKHPDIFLQLTEEGHAIGNHTFNHLNGWKTNTSSYLGNVTACEAIMHQVQPGFTTRLFRPPYGKITPSLINRLSAYRIVMWDVLTYDYVTNLKAETCLLKTLQAIRNGSIIVMHDSLKAWPRLHYVLPRLIYRLSAQGYSFKPLPF